MNSVRSILFAALTVTVSVAAQCDPAWAPGDAPPAMYGTVHHMTTWDPDGAGPLPSVLVCVGDTGGFLTTTARVRTWDGVRWTPLGELTAQSAYAAISWNGQLLVATDNGLLAWTGSTWQTFANVGGIRAMQVYNGELFVTGSFSSVAGVPAANIARWNGSAWSAVGAGLGGVGYAFAVFQNVLYVGGAFNSAGGQPAGNLAIWNGSAWVATATANGAVRAMAARIGTALTNSFLFVGGSFTSLVVPAQHVARYSPSTNSWTAMGSGTPLECTALSVRATGLNSYDLFAAGDDGTSMGTYRWDGASSSWVSQGTASGSLALTSLAVFGGQHVLGALTSQNVAVHRHTGTAWAPVIGEGIEGAVRAVLADGDATFVGGTFPTISGVSVRGIAHGTPGNWTSVGGGVGGLLALNPGILALARMPNGDVVAGGSFSEAGGVPADNIARWNGTTWSALGAGVAGTVVALTVLPNGDLVAGGLFASAGGGLVNNIARWNGTAWSPFGAGFNDVVRAVLACSNGDLVAGGSFTDNGHKIARWNGANWSSLGSGLAADVQSLAELPGGDLLAGWFAGGGGVSRWNGTSWSAAGAPPSGGFDPLALAVLPDGDVLSAGQYGMHRLHGGAWGSTGVTSFVRAIDQGPDEVWRLGGSFDTVAGVASARFARRPLPCPATVTAAGGGCGSNTLTVVSQPWANGVFRAEATGLPTPSWALAVWGLSPVGPPLALDTVFAEALPGCDLHVFPHGIESIPAPAGVASTQLALPNSPPVVGVTFWHQVVVVEVDAQFQLLRVSSSNAVQATIGVF